MGISSIGDLATSTLFRSYNSRLQGEMETLVQELASGKVSIRDTSLGGSYRAISGIERSLTRLDAFDLAATEAEGFADATQSALGAIQETAGKLSVEFLSAGNSGTSAFAEALVSGASQDFETVVGRLNGNYAGRSLFGGVSTDTPPMADAATILAAIEAEITSSGATTASDVASVVETWFNAGGGFDSVGYLGSTQELSPMTVGSGRSVSFETTAQDQEIRDTLAGIAMAALVDTPALGGAPAQQTALAQAAGDKLLNANQDLLIARASVGTLQETIESAQVESQSERSVMDIAMANLLSVDPYERATQLEQVESQIELLYALTVRTSGLKLTNYM